MNYPGQVSTGVKMYPVGSLTILIMFYYVYLTVSVRSETQGWIKNTTR